MVRTIFERVIHKIAPAALCLCLANAIIAGTGQPPWQAFFDRGRTAYAETKYDKAVPLLERALAEASQENASELQKADLWNCLGATYEAIHRLEDARSMFDRALAVRSSSLTAPHEDIAASLTNESSVYWAMAKPREAEDFALRAKRMWEQLGGTKRLEYAVAVNNLLAVYAMQAKFRDAAPLTSLAYDLYRRNLSSGPRLQTALANLGLSLEETGNYPAAEQLFREALQAARSSNDAPPSLVSHLLNDLGNVRSVQGSFADAEKLFTEALAIERGISPSDRIQLAAEYDNLGNAYRSMGRLEQAHEPFQTALGILRGMHGQADMQRGAILNSLGLLAEAEHDLQQAEHFFLEASQSWEVSLGAPHPNTATARSNLARLYEEKHQNGKAEKIFRDVLARDAASYPRLHPAIARDLNDLGTVLFRQHHYAEAESLFREAANIYQKTLGPEHVDTGLTEANLANSLSALKRPNEAQEVYANSLATLEKAWGTDSPKLINILEMYAHLLRASTQSAKAEQAEVHIMHIRVKQAIAAEHSKAQS